jgi:hypothetical protein
LSWSAAFFEMFEKNFPIIWDYLTYQVHGKSWQQAGNRLIID